MTGSPATWGSPGERLAAAFGSRGMVGVLEHAPGVVLLEELRPGTSLVATVLAGEDDRATRILAGVVRSLHEAPCDGVETPIVSEWGEAFDGYLDGGDTRIDRALVARARDRYRGLCETQGEERLLHGDLQHSNLLLDEDRGWTAVDPKGVRGELEYAQPLSPDEPVLRLAGVTEEMLLQEAPWRGRP